MYEKAIFAAGLSLIGCNQLLDNEVHGLLEPDESVTETTDSESDAAASDVSDVSDVGATETDGSGETETATTDTDTNDQTDERSVVEESVDAGRADAGSGFEPGVTPELPYCEDLRRERGPRPVTVPDCSEQTASELCAGTVYVDAQRGSDENDGCSPCSPLRHITDAVERAQALYEATLGAEAGVEADAGIMDAGVAADGSVGADVAEAVEIHVCAGDYTEVDLTLSSPTSLYGGFDCATWQWDPDRYETTIENGSSNRSETLLVEGSSITPETNIAGLNILGTKSQANRASIALHVGSQASPTVFANETSGGSASLNAAGQASVGVRVAGQGTAPTLSCNLIYGGSGSVNVAVQRVGGSTGVFISQGAAPAISHNTIDGGEGTSAVADGAWSSAGISILGDNLDTELCVIEDNVIDGGGSSGQAQVLGVIAIDAQEVQLLRNFIRGGSSTANKVIGVQATGSKHVLIGNRIIAGDSVKPTWGVNLHTTVDSLLANNFVHGGNSQGGAIAVRVSASADVNIEHNTIYSGRAGDTSAALGILINNNSPRASVVGNLLLGSAGVSSSGMRVGRCPDNALMRLSANAFANFSTSLVQLTNADCEEQLTTLEQLLENFDDCDPAADAGVCQQARNNLVIDDDCQGFEERCITRTGCADIGGQQPEMSDEVQCLESLLESWSPDDVEDSADAGVPEVPVGETKRLPGEVELLGEGGGWRLAPHAPCDVIEAVSEQDCEGMCQDVDYFGTRRTFKQSVGAHEQSDDSCTGAGLLDPER